MDTRQCLKILELENVASIDELKQAYLKMVKSWHPDRFHGNPRKEQLAEVKLKEIYQAYKHLCAYFDPDQSKNLKTSNSPSNKKISPGIIKGSIPTNSQTLMMPDLINPPSLIVPRFIPHRKNPSSAVSLFSVVVVSLSQSFVWLLTLLLIWINLPQDP
jgi:hypothetical protein